MIGRWIAHIPPGELIFASFILMIMIGTLILSLPQAQVSPIPFIDLLFTVTSATCVTGLFTISLAQFTLFGKAILLLLIQIGGLGLITMTIFFLSLVIDLGLGTQFIAGQLLEIDSWRKIKRILIFIISITLVSELIGALFFFSIFYKDFPINTAWFFSFFHAVSSFCSAGISVLPNGIEMYQNNYTMLIVTMILMLIGGLGFITWYEIIEYIRSFKNKVRYRFSLHSKIILYGSAVLIFATAITFWILEHDNILGSLSTPLALISSLFSAVSFRSTGFVIYNPNDFRLATLFLIMVISFIGSSPGSTGSGIKITTLAIFLATVKAAALGRTSVEIRGRRITQDQVYKAIGIVTISFAWIAFITFCLLITEPNWRFIDVVFEACAAYTTLGLSTGVTSTLSSVGKLFIIITMIGGRIGSLALIMAIKFHKKKDAVQFQYPEERVMLG